MHVATEGFHTKVNGVPVVVAKGELVDSDHELVARFPQFFKPGEARFTTGGGIEKATKAPGERRGKPATTDE